MCPPVARGRAGDRKGHESRTRSCNTKRMNGAVCLVPASTFQIGRRSHGYDGAVHPPPPPLSNRLSVGAMAATGLFIPPPFQIGRRSHGYDGAVHPPPLPPFKSAVGGSHGCDGAVHGHEVEPAN